MDRFLLQIRSNLQGFLGEVGTLISLTWLFALGSLVLLHSVLTIQKVRNIFPGTKYQKLQKSALANVAEYPCTTTPTVNWYATAKFVNGAVVPHAFLDASYFCVTQRFQGLVQQSLD